MAKQRQGNARHRIAWHGKAKAGHSRDLRSIAKATQSNAQHGAAKAVHSKDRRSIAKATHGSA